MNVKITDKQGNRTTEDKTSDPFDENKFLTNCLTVASDEIFRWRKFCAVQYWTSVAKQAKNAFLHGPMGWHGALQKASRFICFFFSILKNPVNTYLHSLPHCSKSDWHYRLDWSWKLQGELDNRPGKLPSLQCLDCGDGCFRRLSLRFLNAADHNQPLQRKSREINNKSKVVISNFRRPSKLEKRKRI